jgi:hypothetical protein
MHTSTEKEVMVWVAHHESRSQPLLNHFTGFIQGVQHAMLRYFESCTFQLLVAHSRLYPRNAA